MFWIDIYSSTCKNLQRSSLSFIFHIWAVIDSIICHSHSIWPQVGLEREQAERQRVEDHEAHQRKLAEFEEELGAAREEPGCVQPLFVGVVSGMLDQQSKKLV